MHRRYTSLTNKCLNCGIEFHPWIGRPESKYCGSSCAIKYRYSQDSNLGNKLTEKAHKAIKRGKESPKWTGGEYNRRGYIIKTIGYNEKGRIRKEEHILIAEKHIGRKLKPDECVHHINGIKDDNRPENLLVMTKSQHTSLHNSMRFKKAA